MFVIGPQTSNPKSFKQVCGKHETIRNLKSKSPLDALVSIWENSVCTAIISFRMRKWLIFAAIVSAVVYGVIHLAKRILNMDTTRRQ